MAETQEALEDGAVIGGKYRLTRQIGQGGTGSVWQAEHLLLGGSVAIKFLGNQYLRDDDARTRFEREARAASKIRSPHVVQVLEQSTTEGGIPYLAMELLEGEDLADRLMRGPCSLAETATILEPIGRALTKAHTQGLVHRDIKPHNIFLVDDGDDQVLVKLLDFGIAKDAVHGPQVITLTGSVLGSVHYMSPEQLAEPQSVGPAADVWALGVVAYEMLSGKMPFDGATAADVLVRAREGAFVPLTTLRPELPETLDAWLMRAIDPNIAQRFATIEEMTRALSAIARDEAVARNSGIRPLSVPPPAGHAVVVPAPVLPRARAPWARKASWFSLSLMFVAGLLVAWSMGGASRGAERPSGWQRVDVSGLERAAATAMEPIAAVVDSVPVPDPASKPASPDNGATPRVAARSRTKPTPAASARATPASRRPAQAQRNEPGAASAQSRKYRGF